MLRAKVVNISRPLLYLFFDLVRLAPQASCDSSAILGTCNIAITSLQTRVDNSDADDTEQGFSASNLLTMMSTTLVSIKDDCTVSVQFHSCKLRRGSASQDGRPSEDFPLVKEVESDSEQHGSEPKHNRPVHGSFSDRRRSRPEANNKGDDDPDQSNNVDYDTISAKIPWPPWWLVVCHTAEQHEGDRNEVRSKLGSHD